MNKINPIYIHLLIFFLNALIYNQTYLLSCIITCISNAFTYKHIWFFRVTHEYRIHVTCNEASKYKYAEF